MSEKKLRKRSENELLTVVSKFAYELKHEDQMALSAALMVAAKTIYINQLGLEQTQDLFQAMADSMDVIEVEKIKYLANIIENPLCNKNLKLQ